MVVLLSLWGRLIVSVVGGCPFRFFFCFFNKVWPWKEVVETYVDSHDEVKPLIENNIWPNEHIIAGFALMVVGFALVYFLEKLSAKKSE